MAQLRIFVSHSSHDNAWCRPFADALKAVGYDVWYDETGLQGGAAWVDSIQREVENRDVFLLVLTPEAWESKWVQDELQLAIATQRRILPVLLRNTQVSGFLLTTQWITMVGEEPQAAARAAIMAIEAPPAPGRNAAPQAATETLQDLITLCKSLQMEGRYTEALSTCGRALALDPKNLEVLKIKAWLLERAGEHQLEGQTWFQVLLIDPNDHGLWLSYHTIWYALNNEHELLQAYFLLRSGDHSLYLSKHDPGGLERGLISGLNRLNRINAATDVFRQISDNSTRMSICGWLVDNKRYDFLAQLLAAWYGYPPRLNTVADIPMLGTYAQALTGIGRRDDARSIYGLIIRIFEDRYGEALRWRFAKRVFDNYYVPPWNAATESKAYQLYLISLDELGRAHDANRLRKAYPSLST